MLKLIRRVGVNVINTQAHGNAKPHEWSTGGLRIEKATRSFQICSLLVRLATESLKTQSVETDPPVPRAPCPTSHLSQVRLDCEGLAYNTGGRASIYNQTPSTVN